jgi:hypothetical protein
MLVRQQYSRRYPFELLQNANDSALEADPLVEHTSYSPPLPYLLRHGSLECDIHALIVVLPHVKAHPQCKAAKTFP